MKSIKYLFIIALLIFGLACTSDRKENEVTDSLAESTITEEEAIIKKPAIINDIPWSAVLDSATQKYTLRKNNIETTELDSTNVLEAINRKYPENKIVWDYKSGDTAFVKIPNSAYLTQQSGTLGAQVFLAESTYSITEIPGIQVVNYDFKIGDHATPGLYRRKDFNFSMPK